MNQTLKRFTHGAVATLTALGVSTLGLASATFASQLKNVIVTPTATTAGTTGVTFNFSLTAPSTGSYKSWSFVFATTPSDASGSNNIANGAYKPANLGIVGTPTATVTDTAFGAGSDTNFSVASTIGGSNSNIITLTASTPETVSGSNTSWNFSIPGINMPSIGDCNGNTGGNTDTCYVRIFSTTTGAIDGTGILDQAVGSYTFTSQINLSATVDPYMTFSVAGVNSNFSTYDANAIAAPTVSNIGTAITTTTGTNIPFGNITVGTDKFAMQQLDVRTNASLGYNVYQKMTTSNGVGQALEGTFTTGGVVNHIDSFTNSSSWDGSGNVTATAWVEPTGLPNTLSGWLALQSAGPTGIGSFGTGWAGPVLNSGGTGGIVKSKGGPDNGITGNTGSGFSAGTSAYVVYRISVDAYQPADSYTGTMQYNVVATY